MAKQLLFFTIPFMASNALQVLYSTIDMIIVGEYVGTPGLSAVSQSSQNIAAKKQKRAVQVVRWAWVYSAALTVLFMTACVVFGKQLFMVFSDDPLVHAMSGDFIRAIMWMFPALAVMRGSGAFIQGLHVVAVEQVDGLGDHLHMPQFFGSNIQKQILVMVLFPHVLPIITRT